MYRWATAIATPIIAAISVVAVAAVVARPTRPDTPEPTPTWPTIRAAEQAPARPDDAPFGSCDVNGKRFPNGATVPLDPGPRSAMLAPVYVRCVQGKLCYDTTPAVYVPAGTKLQLRDP